MISNKGVVANIHKDGGTFTKIFYRWNIDGICSFFTSFSSRISQEYLGISSARERNIFLHCSEYLCGITFISEIQCKSIFYGVVGFMIKDIPMMDSSGISSVFANYSL